MQEIFIGELIRQRRMELGITQEALCEGICEPVTISRLENGHQTPTRNRLNALLQRLGLPAERCYALISRQEAELERLQSEARAECVRAESAPDANRADVATEAWAAMEQLERAAEPDDRQTQQLILKLKAILGQLNGRYTLEQCRELTLEAIRLTVPRFDFDCIGNFLYSLDEVHLIGLYAIYYIDEGRPEALPILQQLWQYVLTHNQAIKERSGELPWVAHCLALAYMVCGDYKSALKIAEEGHQICIQRADYRAIGGLLSTIVECQWRLGNTEEAKSLSRELYYFQSAVGFERGRELTKAEAKAWLDYNLEE